MNVYAVRVDDHDAYMSTTTYVRTRPAYDADDVANYVADAVAARLDAADHDADYYGVPYVDVERYDGDAVRRAVEGADVGTWVEPRESSLGARKLWIAFSLPAAGTLTVDDGAVDALVENGRSLLAAGITSVQGDFDRGDAVEIRDRSGRLVGKGLAGLSGAVLQEVRGRHTSVAGGVAVHRDDLIILL
jgi:glutamate 5-kinase